MIIITSANDDIIFFLPCVDTDISLTETGVEFHQTNNTQKKTQERKKKYRKVEAERKEKVMNKDKQ